MIQRIRAVLLVLAGLLYVASWPGASVRAITIDLVAPSIPKEILGRDGILDVVVHEAGPAKDKDDANAIAIADKPVLAGAKVRAFAILDGRAHAAGEAVTDKAGRATIKDLPQAEHWIVAELEGHSRGSQMVVVVAGPRRLDLELGLEHTLDVEVKDEAQNPMVGAEIEIRGSGGGDPFPVGARTGGNGRVRVGRLGEGPFNVIARAPGFEEVTKRRVPEGSTALIILGKQGALAVEVVLEDGSPAPSSKVFLGSSAFGATRVAETDKDGKVRIAGLDRGSYAIRAVGGGGAGGSGPPRVSPIELGIIIDKGEEKPVRLTLLPGVMISAHVVDAASEEDVKDARVTLAENGVSPFPLDGVTDKRGRIVLGPIARGPSSLSARADGFVPKAAISLDEPPSSEVKIALARGGVLIGKITDARGYAVDGATIHVVGTDLDGMPIDEDPSRWSFREAHFASNLKGPSPLLSAGELGVMPGPVPPIPHGPSVGLSFNGATTTTTQQGAVTTVSADPWVSGRDGMFRATPVTPGRVRAFVHHPQYVEAMSEVVLLESSKEARVDVVLQRGGILEGRVVDGRSRPIAGAHVTALATRGSLEHATRTGTDGSFAFAALPDAVTILVSRDEDTSVVAARAELTIPEGGKKTIEIVLPDPRPALPVKVVDHRANGIDAAQVSAVSLDPGEAMRVTAFTDPRGRAELASGRGIALRVEVRAQGHAARTLMTTPEMTELVVELKPAESVTGEVVTRGRRDPIPNADVTLTMESAGVRHARTNKDGVFTIGDVSAGPARLRVRVAGRAPDEKAITIEDRGGRKPTEIPRFELAEEGVVEGSVVDGRGDPIAGARVAKDAVPTYLPVGVTPAGIAVTDGRGHFRLGELGEGSIALEAYAADVGRTRKTEVRVNAGRTTNDVKLVITRGGGGGAADQNAAANGSKEPLATGGVAITLGETSTSGVDVAPEVVIVAVSDGSEAERGGLAVNDIIVEVSGAKVVSITDARARLSGPVHDDVLVKVRRGERLVALRVSREPVRR